MQLLKGKLVLLRALEPEDLDFLFEIENNTTIWTVSNTLQPYSKHLLRQYLNNVQQDITEAKQLRLVICNLDGATIGLIDLYDFDSLNQRVGLGIVIKETKDHQKGYGTEAVELLIRYIFKVLLLHQVYVSISEENTASIRLFQKLNFINCGIKKDWKKTSLGYTNEHFYQLINPNSNI